MANLEKVIKGLEYHLKELSVGKTCYECPYFGDNPCEIQLIANALELLEPIEPIEERLNEADSIYRCGNCKTHFYYRQQKYCAICGRMAKWDG